MSWKPSYDEALNRWDFRNSKSRIHLAAPFLRIDLSLIICSNGHPVAKLENNNSNNGNRYYYYY